MREVDITVCGPGATRKKVPAAASRVSLRAMNARLALFAFFGLFGCASNVAPDGSPNAEPSAALSSQPPATSASPSSSQASATPSSASSAQTSGSANAESDCKQEPWPTFKAPALAAAEAPALATGTASAAARAPAKKPTPKPSAEAGDIPGAAEVVQSMSPDFGRCLTRQLCEDPRTEAKLRLTLTIDPLGQVSAASSTGANPEQALFARCIESAAKAKRFSPPQGGIGTLVVPLNFKAGT